MRTLFQELADFLLAISRIFADPAVQEAGDKLGATLTKAMDRELGLPELPERTGTE